MSKLSQLVRRIDTILDVHGGSTAYGDSTAKSLGEKITHMCTTPDCSKMTVLEFDTYVNKSANQLINEFRAVLKKTSHVEIAKYCKVGPSDPATPIFSNIWVKLCRRTRILDFAEHVIEIQYQFETIRERDYSLNLMEELSACFTKEEQKTFFVKLWDFLQTLSIQDFPYADDDRP